jgi:hypothetical protein
MLIRKPEAMKKIQINMVRAFFIEYRTSKEVKSYEIDKLSLVFCTQALDHNKD